MTQTMQLQIFRVIGLALIAVVMMVSATALSIPADQLDAKQVFWGTASSFEKPGEINYEEIVKATPEYQDIKRKKLQRGTGEYWILMSQASDRAVRAVSEVGQNTEYDLIAAEGYLGSLDPAIEAEDITDLVLDQLEEDA